MKPDRSNYEIWIIDWLDGKLDESATGLLMAFLGENPDLRKEADSLLHSLITSGNAIYPDKEDLKKNISEFPLSQVEYLSVAYLENEISPEQMSDLEQALQLDQKNRIAFDNIQRIKLTPPPVSFKNKNDLKKQTTVSRVFRLASVWMSAAAVIALLIYSSVLIQRYYSSRNDQSEQIIASGPVPESPFIVRTMTFTAPPEEPLNILNKTEMDVLTQTHSENEIIQSALTVFADTSVIAERPVVEGIQGITVFPVPGITTELPLLLLAGSNNNYHVPDFYEEDRSRISRFLARNFREKILKEPVVNDSPLKSYEIAEAGIEGINKLLGWEMALVKNNGEGGELKSVYFSSRLLKFNAPVKKIELLP